MSVIAHLTIPADSFELGQILPIEGSTRIRLESMVPLGEHAIPLFSVHHGLRDTFEQTVRDHPSVRNIEEVSTEDDTTVFALDWNAERDLFFEGLVERDGHVLSARGSAETWTFEIRFPDHESLAAFNEYCASAHIPLEVGRIYNPTRPGSGPWFGLTPPQRDALVRAVQGGYYAIPRRMSTQELAEELDISDQAVTERLRRGITTLVENTLVTSMKNGAEYE